MRSLRGVSKWGTTHQSRHNPLVVELWPITPYDNTTAVPVLGVCTFTPFHTARILAVSSQNPS
jgi:hypothetical protein